MHRFCPLARRPLAWASTAPIGAALSMPRRYVGEGKEGMQKRIENDEHWLEAEFDENINKPEERYAHQKEMERMREMLKNMKQESTQKIENVKSEKDRDVEQLKQQLKSLSERLESLTKK